MAFGLETGGYIIGGLLGGASGGATQAGPAIMQGMATGGALGGTGGSVVGLATGGPVGAVVEGGVGAVGGAAVGGALYGAPAFAQGAIAGTPAGAAKGEAMARSFEDWVYHLTHAGEKADEHPDQPTDRCTGDCGKPSAPSGAPSDSSAAAVTDVPGKIPFRGPPGRTIRGPKDSRTYGPDGFPQTDRNEPHASEAGIGNGDHSHDWERPADGSDPTHIDRGPPRLPQSGDPPPPRGF